MNVHVIIPEIQDIASTSIQSDTRSVFHYHITSGRGCETHREDRLGTKEYTHVLPHLNIIYWPQALGKQILPGQIKLHTKDNGLQNGS